MTNVWSIPYRTWVNWFSDCALTITALQPERCSIVRARSGGSVPLRGVNPEPRSNAPKTPTNAGKSILDVCREHNML